jgi:hypothetical protein
MNSYGLPCAESKMMKNGFSAPLIVNAKNSFRITRKTRFLKKSGFPDLSGKNFYHMQRLHWCSSAHHRLYPAATKSRKMKKLPATTIYAMLSRCRRRRQTSSAMAQTAMTFLRPGNGPAKHWIISPLALTSQSMSMDESKTPAAID